MKNYKYNYHVEISYDGNYFYGWSKQPDRRTVQETVEGSLSKIFNEKIKITGSGRTDRYVHAISQWFNFHSNHYISEDEIMKSINRKYSNYLLKSVRFVDNSFNSRFDAKEKTYQYKILTNWNDDLTIFLDNYYYLYSKPINKNILKEFSEKLIGLHDFNSFTAKENYVNTQKNLFSVEFIENKIDGIGNEFIIEFKGESFLRYMVRNMVGSLLALSEEIITEEEFIDYLIKPIKGKTVHKAKANALYLTFVNYK